MHRSGVRLFVVLFVASFGFTLTACPGGGGGGKKKGAAGELDTTFGGTGYVVHDDAAGGMDEDLGRGITVDSSGRILVTGQSRNAAFNDDMVIWRFNPDGTIDTTFNFQGWVVHDDAAGGTGADRGHAITEDALGRILVTGDSQSAATGRDMVIWRFMDDGSLDTAFNGQGWVVDAGAAGGTGNDRGYDIIEDALGRILVTGTSQSAATGRDMVIWRFDPDGTLDTAFNGQGWVVDNGAAGGTSTDEGRGITLDASGRILVAGRSRNANFDHEVAVWRFNPVGTLDTTLNGQGFVTHDVTGGGNGENWGNGIAVDKSGSILVGGHTNVGGGRKGMTIWRFNPIGTLDLTFNGQGFVRHASAAGGSGKDDGKGITVDRSGRILVAGYSRRLSPGSPNGGDLDMVVWQFNADGSLDFTFGNGGVFIHNNAGGGDRMDRGAAIALDAKGRILVTGRTKSPADIDMAVWRIK